MCQRALLLIVICGLVSPGLAEANTRGKGPKKVPSKLEKELVKVARDAYTIQLKLVEVGRDPHSETLFLWSRRWLDAQRAISTTKADELAAYKAHWERMKEMEKQVKVQFDAKQIQAKLYYTAKYYRVQAELWYTQAAARK